MTDKKNTEAFYQALAMRESSLKLDEENKKFHYVGLYQMGEAALQDAGYYKSDGTKDNDWRGDWTGKDGIHSLEDFKNSEPAQTNAIRAYHQIIWNNYLKDHHHYEGKVVDGITLSKSGMIAGAHLVGHGELKKFLNDSGSKNPPPKDGNGVLITQYLKPFSGYDIDFSAKVAIKFRPNEKTFNPTKSAFGPDTLVRQTLMDDNNKGKKKAIKMSVEIWEKKAEGLGQDPFKTNIRAYSSDHIGKQFNQLNFEKPATQSWGNDFMLNTGYVGITGAFIPGYGSAGYGAASLGSKSPVFNTSPVMHQSNSYHWNPGTVKMPHYGGGDPVTRALHRHFDPIIQRLSSYTVHPMLDKSIKHVGSARNHISPLVIDMNRDGKIGLSHAYTEGKEAVYFDIDNDGFVERVGWPKAEEGQLARDNNGNGLIDNITELYGDDAMPAFRKLALLDENQDHVIDAKDPEYANLRIWQDANQNGVSEEGELKSLEEVGITSINLQDTPDTGRVVEENYISSHSFVKWKDGRTSEIADVHYLNDNLNTWYRGAHSQVYGSNVEVDFEALMLPLSRGYGSMPSLHIAMSWNPALKALVQEYTELTPTNFYRAGDLMEEILFTWAGVKDIAKALFRENMGNNIDGRWVRFIEQFTGVTWKQLGANHVGAEASISLKAMWSEITATMHARLLVQGAFSELAPEALYSFVHDKLLLKATAESIVNAAAELEKQHPMTAQETAGIEQQRITYWLHVANILVQHQEELNQTTAQINALIGKQVPGLLWIGEYQVTPEDGSLYSSTMAEKDQLLQEFTQVGNDQANVMYCADTVNFIFSKGGDDDIRCQGGKVSYINTGDGNDRVTLSRGQNFVFLGRGDDIFQGGEDDETANGGEGNDSLHGNEGDDKLSGGPGADLLDGGSGKDTAMYYSSKKGVDVNLKTGEARGGDAQGDRLVSIENIEGSDLADTLTGDDGPNVIQGNKGDDTMRGGTGDDTLAGPEGNKQYFGEDGDDIIAPGVGKELVDGGPGTDTVSYEDLQHLRGVHVDLLRGKGFSGPARGDRYVSIENLRGTYNSDCLIGNHDANIIYTNDGNDQVFANAGNDTIVTSGGLIQKRENGENNGQLQTKGGHYLLWGGAGSDRFVLPPNPKGTIAIMDHDLTDTNESIDISAWFNVNVSAWVNATPATCASLFTIGNDQIFHTDQGTLIFPGMARSINFNIPVALPACTTDLTASDSVLYQPGSYYDYDYIATPETSIITITPDGFTPKKDAGGISVCYINYLNTDHTKIDLTALNHTGEMKLNYLGNQRVSLFLFNGENPTKRDYVIVIHQVAYEEFTDKNFICNGCANAPTILERYIEGPLAEEHTKPAHIITSPFMEIVLSQHSVGNIVYDEPGRDLYIAKKGAPDTYIISSEANGQDAILQYEYGDIIDLTALCSHTTAYNGKMGIYSASVSFMVLQFANLQQLGISTHSPRLLSPSDGDSIDKILVRMCDNNGEPQYYNIPNQNELNGMYQSHVHWALDW